jgi:hypothetical protein
MHLSLQEASSTFNCAAYASLAAGSLNRRWTIVRPDRLKVVCLRHGRLGVGPVVGHPQHADCSTNNAAVANDCCVYSCSRVVVQLSKSAAVAASSVNCQCCIAEWPIS